ncbi:class I SAM-dependent DNA methyltransferase [Bacillus solitudinis]|uniref:class I SAM-dependent DNA methyltransferase n=1 Tax=Bacillus solitudinis TaxID=2014074 RepID=UPI000C243E1E|nr:class I SAM-dependent methyltransferase [Bacillus solitudinis]
MSYQKFASLYDALMEEAPYEEWVEVLKRSIGKKHLHDISILDVACGTGELLIRLLDEGADVAGVDLSADMLVIAKEKCEVSGYSPLLFEQNMADMPKLGEFDVVTAFCDSLNYLSTEQEVQKALKCFAEQLSSGGILLFDVHSTSKIESGFIGQTFADDGEDTAYIWTSFAGEHPYSVEHELTFFVKRESGLYERFTELHKQRTFPLSSYQTWLEEAGFVVQDCFADFESKSPDPKSERIFIKAQKK